MRTFSVSEAAGTAESVWRPATVWEVRGSNPSGARHISLPSEPAPRPNQPPLQRILRLPPEVKLTRRDVDQPPPSSAQVKGYSYIPIHRTPPPERFKMWC